MRDRLPGTLKLWPGVAEELGGGKAYFVRAGVFKDVDVRPAALRYFETLAPSYRRRYVGWIESAKHDETKARRLKEAIRLLAAGKVLGLK